MTLQGAILTVDGDSFAMHGNISLSAGIRTGYILEGTGDTWTAIWKSLVEATDLPVDWEFREGIYLDLGGGAHVVEIEFKGWKGSNLAWGDGYSDADPITQLNVLEQKLVETQIDSFRPAILEYGEYSPSGMFEPLEVAVEGPRFTHSADDPSTFTGEMVCIAVAAINSEVFGDALKMLG